MVCVACKRLLQISDGPGGGLLVRQGLRVEHLCSFVPKLLENAPELPRESAAVGESRRRPGPRLPRSGVTNPAEQALAKGDWSIARISTPGEYPKQKAPGGSRQNFVMFFLDASRRAGDLVQNAEVLRRSVGWLRKANAADGSFAATTVTPSLAKFEPSVEKPQTRNPL